MVNRSLNVIDAFDFAYPTRLLIRFLPVTAMYISMPYVLSMDEPSIIFIPPPDEKEIASGDTPREPFAMQVIIKQAG
jgi:hypothetical protein